MYKQRPHVKVHEILPYGILILHLDFFFNLFYLVIFTITKNFTLTFYYCYLINCLSFHHTFLSLSCLLAYPRFYCSGLFNERYCFTITKIKKFKKKPKIDKAFLRERKRNLKGYHLRHTGLPPPSSC